MDKELIEEKFKNHEEKIKDHDKRINKLEDTYATLTNINYRMNNMEESIKSIDEVLLSYTKNKGKKWDRLIDYLFYAVLGVLLAYIAVKLGLK